MVKLRAYLLGKHHPAVDMTSTSHLAHFIQRIDADNLWDLHIVPAGGVETFHVSRWTGWKHPGIGKSSTSGVMPPRVEVQTYPDS